MRATDDVDTDALSVFGRVDPSDAFERERSRAQVTSALLGERNEAPKIGPYFVLERLGAGGMGVVYAAFDPRLGRKVAIKVLHGACTEGRHGSAEGILREARALARLSHPNVVAVHDVGTHDGGVYLAMAFVDGQTLGHWMGIEPRSWSEVLDVVRAAGRGLQAAHAAGLVHRDFKPDNVLIGTDGQVRVADFGLARADTTVPLSTELADLTDGDSVDRLTQTGAIVGTPRYMAPEQHLGAEVGPAADQYSLCLTLAEGLCGKFPLANTLLALVEQKVSGVELSLEQDAQSSRVPSWLQRTIVRGLSPEPDLRFASMSDLLDALAPPRRRTAVIVGGAAIAVAGLGAGVSIAGPRAAPSTEPSCPNFTSEIATQWSPAKRAELVETITRSGAPSDVELAEPALRRLDTYAQTWASARGELCERQLAHREPDTVFERRLECLERARIELQARVDVLASPRAGQVPRMVSIVQTLPPLEECVAGELPELRAYAPADPAHREARQRGLKDIAAVSALILAGRWDEARTRLDRLSEAHADALRDDPIVAFRYHLAQAWARTGEERIDHNYAAVQAAIIAGSDGDVQMAYYELANRLYDEKRFDESRRAISLGQAQVEAYRRRTLSERVRNNASVAKAKFTLMRADVAREAGESEEAIAAFTEGIAVLRASPVHDGLAIVRALNNLAEVYRMRGNYTEAGPLYEEAMALAETELGPGHPDIATMLDNRASVAFDTGHLREALPDLDRALEILLASVGPKGEAIGLTRFNIGVIALTYGDYATARIQLEEARAVWRAGGMRTAAFVHVAVAALAAVTFHEGNDEEALRLHVESVEGLHKVFGGPHPVLAQVIAEHGTTLLEMGQPRKARVQTRRASEMIDNSFGAESYGAGAVLLIDGHVSLALDDVEAAVALYERVQVIFDRLGNPVHPGWASLHAGWAEVARRRGKTVEAARHEAQIDAVMVEHPKLVVWAREGLRRDR